MPGIKIVHCASTVSICSLPRFLARHGDTDISGLMSSSVPPVDLDRVQIFSSALRKFKAEAGLRILFFGEYIVFVLFVLATAPA